MKWLTRLFVAVLVVGLFVAVLVVGLSVLPVLANGCPRPKPVKQTIVRVCVDHTRTLTQLIEAGKYDWINQTIAQYIFKHTLESGTESVTTDIILLDFHQPMTSEQVLVEMNRLGLRPADLRELLSLGVQQPKLLQEKHLIVALGDVFQINGDRLVAYLSRSDSVRDLNLDWFDDEWSGICRFAAVRK